MPASRSPSAHPRAIIVMATMMAIAAANSSMDAHSYPGIWSQSVARLGATGSPSISQPTVPGSGCDGLPSRRMVPLDFGTTLVWHTCIVTAYGALLQAAVQPLSTSSWCAAHVPS